MRVLNEGANISSAAVRMSSAVMDEMRSVICSRVHADPWYSTALAAPSAVCSVLSWLSTICPKY